MSAPLREVRAPLPCTQHQRALGTALAAGVLALEETLAALTATMPCAAFLFDDRGRLRWMSDEGALRLETGAHRLGASAALERGDGALQALSLIAVRAFTNPTGASPAVDALATGVARSKGPVSVRLFTDGPRPLALLVMAGEPRCAAEVPVSPECPDFAVELHLDVTSLGLGPARSQVVALAAEGFAVLNIAARLGVSEATVRTHLRRAYATLGVHSRAELGCRIHAAHAPASTVRMPDVAEQRPGEAG